VSHDVADGHSIKAVSGLNISEALQAETIGLRAKSEIARKRPKGRERPPI
jgi:hypothetical protein